MQGLITLDFGNTNPHAGLFHKTDSKWELLRVVPLNELAIYLTQFEMNPHNSSVVICEVKARESEVQKLQEQGFLVTRIKDYWRGKKFAGMPVSYAHTLGEDRLIEAFYAFKNDQTPTLIIDAGTFVTMDVVTQDGFLGGHIIPGISAYFSVFEKGEQLKNTLLTASFTGDLPDETSKAMTESYTAFAALAKGLIENYKIQKVLLTGGSMNHWAGFFRQEKVPPVVVTHPHLIHLALQFWMTTQIEPL